jgi:hypothetical protein
MARKLQQSVRVGWARASRSIAAAGEDKLVWPEFRNEADVASCYRLKITLADVRPPVWRRIEILGDTTLARLHRIIQATMGWEDSHLHVFRIGDLQYGVPDPELPFVNEKRVRIDEIVGRARQRFAYLYDFGDHWLHNVVVESISPADPHTTYPRLIDGCGACPPEDVGGPPGYESFIAIIRDQSHPEHARMQEWVGGRFDPAVLDSDGITSALRRLTPR